MRRAANWLQAHLTAIGMNARLVETSGNPLVYAEARATGAGQPC